MAIEDFEALPIRIFLDSSVIQTLRNYGSFIWENEELPVTDKLFRIPEGMENLEALRNIFIVVERASFEFAVSENSLIEAAAHTRDSGLLQWAYDVLDHWLVCQEESGGATEVSVRQSKRLYEQKFGYLGEGDRSLIRDAIQLRCDSFLTMERRLPKNSSHIERELGLKIITPKQYWELLRPWSRLWV